MNRFFFALLIMVFVSNFSAQAQPRKAINGKIVSDVSELEGVYILNMNTEQTAITKSGGYFSIDAQSGDSIMVSSIQLKAVIVKLAAEDFKESLLFIKAEAMIHALDEVKIVHYKDMDAVALGIVTKKPKTYTPAERKLKTASDFDAKIGLNTSIQIDPILNALSGRTAMLRKQVVAERKEFLIAYISNMFEEKYFIEKLHVPAAYVKGFLYYLVESEYFVKTVKNNNKSMSTFVIGEMAVKFNETIACEGE